MSGSEIKTFKGIDEKRLESILRGIENLKVALLGDLCLDVYWRADMTKSELSRETPHFPLPVVEERVSPGAGGNAVSNIAALKPQKVYAIGVVGMDWRGDVLLQELKKRNIDTSKIIISSKRITNAYCKPLRRGISEVEYEDPRIDFSNHEPLPSEDEEKIMIFLEQVAGEIDVLCITDQLEFGCVTSKIRAKISTLAKQGLKVVVDSRNNIGLYSNIIIKPNEIEAYRAVYEQGDPRKATIEELLTAAEILSERNNTSVCMTLGPRGCIFVDKNTAIHIPSYEVKRPLDICGAGDTFLSAFSCALATGALSHEAASFANIAADVTIKKIGTTGSTTPDEIKSRHTEIFKLINHP